MLTIYFSDLIDEDSEIWSIVDKTKYPHLFPQGVEDLTDEMIDNIQEHFYDRQIGFSSPTRFLRHFHRLVKERAYVWKKLIESERSLSDNDRTRNYDLYEEGRHIIDEGESGTSTLTPNTTTTVTPNVTTQTTEQSTDLNHMMDTPDGITADIDDYMSQAEKNQNNLTSSTSSTGSTTTTNTGTQGNTFQTSREGDNTNTLHRYGNIGVQTAAQILGGYREAQVFDAYDSVIFPEISQLFLNTVDIDDIDLW